MSRDINSLVLVKSLIFKFYYLLVYLLFMFKLFSFMYDDVFFAPFPYSLLFGSSFVVLGYFFMFASNKVLGKEFFNDLDFELYLTNMFGLVMFTSSWIILSII